MRNPNGYGGINKLSGNRRRPYRVRVTDGWTTDEAGKTRQQYKIIGWYATYEEANKALADYHANPYSLEQNITFSEVYEKWSAEKFPTISDSNVNGYKASYGVCSELYKMKFTEIRRNHLQAVVDTCGKNYPTLRKLKVLFHQLYTYAIQNDLCDKDYSDFVDISKHKDPDSEPIHRPFTAEEIHTIAENAGRSQWIAVIYILIYSGVRISELLDVRKENVHLDEQYFDIKKSKTAAGIRKVPIADIVLPYWKEFMETPGDYLLYSTVGNKMTYAAYYPTNFTQPLEQLGIKDHYPHDTRHTCISLLVAAGVDRRLIKRIVGHQGEDVTDTVYTHYEINQLVEAINKIKV